MYLLDADILIDMQRDYEPALTWFDSLNPLPAVPGFVVMELIQAAQNARQVREAMRLVKVLPVIWPSEADCQRALEDFESYHLSHGLGLLDSLIAACAVGASKKLCTFNVKHYRVISGLETEQPYRK